MFSNVANSDNANGATAPNDGELTAWAPSSALKEVLAATLAYMQATFNVHCKLLNPRGDLVAGMTNIAHVDNGNRQPIGLYTHPIHVAVGFARMGTSTDF